MQTPDLVYALGLPPRDAVAYLESKGITPTRHWHDIWQEAQAKAVTVSGMTRLDLLEDVKAGLVDAVKNGKTEKMFIDNLAPILRAKGWTGKREKVDPTTGEVTEKGPDLPARLSLIFTQNVQSAYMYGRYRAMLANAEERPWWMYVAVLDSRTRPHHAALNRKVFRYDDPFWKTHYPPNGFRCRCRTRALSDTQLEREDLTPESGEGRMVSREVVVNPRAPEEQQIVREVWGWQQIPGGLTHWTDTGFSYSAGDILVRDELARIPDPAQVTTWKSIGLPSLRAVFDGERLSAPALLPVAETQEEAERQLAKALGFTEGQDFLTIETPMGTRIIRRELLPHMVEKRADARERFANYVLPTLQQPFEVWLKEHADGKLRENYLGLFRDSKYALIVVVRINRDGSLMWNMMNREPKKMDNLREGILVHRQKN